MSDQRVLIGRLLEREPRLELRTLIFPARRVVLAVVFDGVGEITVPMFADQARGFAATLVALADELGENVDGSAN
jgi:hypothetical protein